jgi:puromycin-sensitive aminopeptidase
LKDADRVEGLATRFEPSLAKTLLPCFDEPAFKAVFNVTARYPASVDGRVLTLITNTGEFEKRRDASGMMIVRFHESPAMAVYGLVFILDNLDYIETMSARGVPIRMYARPDKLGTLEVRKLFCEKNI